MVSDVSSPALDLNELEEKVFASARGGKRIAAPLSIEVVRQLGLDDLPKIENPSRLGSKPPAVQHLRASHHNLARLIAMGRPTHEVSAISGYSPNYISILLGNQDFAELVEHYKFQANEVQVDLLERMKVLGLSTLDEIQRRLEENPDDWTKQQLLDLAELALVKSGSVGPKSAPVGTGASVAPPVFNISFVKADHTKRLEKHPGLTIDLEASETIERE